MGEKGGEAENGTVISNQWVSNQSQEVGWLSARLLASSRRQARMSPSSYRG